ncbi:hypothetical protein [Campylobacter sp. CCUG 57310]|uniref:hypothetical protein n=1 Tax=Campylobacter sp. CCUG 57310 TaxID=2517362 RepID=UPI0015632111|nr:hypothetical protein [Campylobacter sp. CCUG 57310]QKF91438.1 YceI-like domain-containing periplasmic protein [Campylobacter sp. CCUG 57310]
MNKIISSVVASMLLASSAFAFSAKGDPELGYIGYKTAAKTAVPGVFKKFEFKSTKSDKFADFAKSIEINIDSNGIETKPKTPLRDNRIIAIFKKEPIMAKIVDVQGDENKGVFKLEITTNAVTKTYDAPYELKDGMLMAKAIIDVLDFNLNETFAKFAEECKALHAGKTWSETEVSLKLAVEK